MYSDKGVLRYFQLEGPSDDLYIELRSRTITGWISDLHIGKNVKNSVIGTIRGDVELFGSDGPINKLSSDDMHQPVPVGDVAISADGLTVAYSTWGGKEPHFVITGEKYYVDEITEDIITRIALSSNGSYVAGTIGEGTVGKLFLRSGDGNGLWSIKTSRIHDLLITDDGSVVIAGTDDGVIHAYSHSGDPMWTYQADGPITALSMTPSASKIVAGTPQGTIYLLDKNGTLLGKYQNNSLFNTGVSQLEISKDGGSLIALTNNRELIYFKTEDDVPMVSGTSKPFNSDSELGSNELNYSSPDFSYSKWLKQTISESGNNLSFIVISDNIVNYWSGADSSSSPRYTPWIFPGQNNISRTGISGRFTTEATPSINVISPKGGEIWERNTSRIVEWNYKGSPGSTVDIVLLKEGIEVGWIANRVPSGSEGTGSYTWPIYSTGMTGNDFKVSIRDTKQSSINGVSNGNFTITPATIIPP
ncbi:MAG: hypothetical protein WCJ93_00055 [Methanomicrobiales archaeon]